MESIAAEKIAGQFLEWDLIEDEKAKLAERSKALFKAMKDDGYDTKAARVAFREKRAELIASPDDVSKAEAEEAMLDLYRAALTNGLRSRARPAHARESQSYAEVKGRGFVATLSDEQKAEALAYRGDDTHGEITEQEQPEEPATEFHRHASPETGSAGDPSPTHGEKDLVEAGTGHNCAVLPQEPCTAEITPSADSPAADKPETAVTPLPAVSGAISDEDVPAFLKKDRDPVNERCEKPLTCKFGRHPQKLTCSTCTTAWAIAHRKAVTA